MAELDALKFELQDESLGGTRIKVLGVGGGGSNAVNRMIEAGIAGVEFFVLNTDAQALRASRCQNRIALGTRITHGLGAGSDPDIGRQAALEDTDRIVQVIEGADMVFIAAGLGGGTGTGAAPVVAALARELGALTVAVVTRPFSFEGPRRMRQADQGLAELHATVDTVISIPNDRLVELVPPGTSFFEAFRLADDVLRQGVQGISDIIATPGLINRDFADVRAIMSGMGFAMMGMASAKGEGAAVEAARGAIRCPLIDEGGIGGAQAILINICASGNLALHDMHNACKLIQEAAGGEDVQINLGIAQDEKLGDEVRVTVIATGFQRPGLPEAQAPDVRGHVHATGGAVAGPAALEAPAPVVEPVIVERVTPIETLPPPRYAAPAPESEPQPEPEPEEAPFELDFAEPEPKPAPPAATPKPAAPVAINEPDDVFSLDDIDTPPVLRRERR